MSTGILRPARSPAWHDGFKAQRTGKPSASCPHLSGNDIGGFNNARMDWFGGWYDAKHQLKWPDWLEIK